MKLQYRVAQKLISLIKHQQVLFDYAKSNTFGKELMIAARCSSMYILFHAFNDATNFYRAVPNVFFKIYCITISYTYKC